jgi:tetratricopeptide (TPR) repeat protein
VSAPRAVASEPQGAWMRASVVLRIPRLIGGVAVLCAAQIGVLCAALIGVVAPASLAAQDTPPVIRVPPAPPPEDSARTLVFQRAQRLVNDGNGAEGRGLLDSLLNATPPRAPEEADILFWRATLAESWEQAQRDYLRIMLEHDRSPRAAAAMLRLAQGEMTRGDREGALRYLERLAREAPESELRAEAALWQGRLLIGGGARTDGCLVLRENRVRVRSGALELEQQYEHLLRECALVAQAAPTTAPAPPARPATPAVPTPTQAPAPTPPTATDAVWSVQIAAFPTNREAANFAAEMRQRGYDTRVDGTAAPFRVRFGRYATQAEATEAMNAYKTKERSDAFLARVPRE